ncbi:alpha-ribazole phosphatase family protein [Ulvibacterium sp.]|uniref:alpha-ribazole phosphatase family protein n=1 Tax=Ulvibacterium sp. TaxID=2665914 RepID=UPI002623D98E|nr:alpha-ribazole phosphatase family protein [Ulvibacterium sp.]
MAKGICYGQSDIPLAETFLEESKSVLAQLPDTVDVIYTSPLKRCLALAKRISHQKLEKSPNLMEMDFGDWELKPWDQVPKQELNPWMEDFVNYQVPNGESMQMLAHRVNQWYKALLATHSKKVIVVTHAGPIRILLSRAYQTPLEEAFERYQVGYGEVIPIGKTLG